MIGIENFQMKNCLTKNVFATICHSTTPHHVVWRNVIWHNVVWRDVVWQNVALLIGGRLSVKCFEIVAKSIPIFFSPPERLFIYKEKKLICIWFWRIKIFPRGGELQFGGITDGSPSEIDFGALRNFWKCFQSLTFSIRQFKIRC